MNYVNLIFLSSNWTLNHRKGLHTNINKRLSEWSEVIFIETPLSILYHTFFKFGKRVLPLIKHKKGIKEVKTFSPLAVFHQKIWKKIPLTLRFDSWLVSVQIKRLIKKKFPKSKVITWANSPYDYAIIKLMKPEKIVYDYYDNFSYDNNGNLEGTSDALNGILIADSGLIFCTGRVMYDFAKSMNNNSWYVPNGHNLNSGKKITKTDLKVEGKIIGYLGNIRDWIDFELINKLLNSLKENNYLFFIGPVEKNVSGEIEILKKNNNFKHLNAVKYTEIFSYLKGFDIGIIPFKINRFTEGVLPYKFFEYIAADIAIVSTALPDIVPYQSIINVAKNNDEFVEMCVDENLKLNKNKPGYDEVRKESTWEKRADFIESKLKILLNNI
ncbi:MAG: hypothetical protein M3R36_14115 [Bacteroidota bacterium]|nr:hypothetical protein [Bacteroidota bacterium]